MTELPLVFLGGLLGSSHCVGMCGPLALAIGMNQHTLKANLVRQLLFSAGRIITYSFGGAGAAWFGWWLTQRPALLVNVQAVLSIVSGVALIVIGLSATGLVPPRSSRFVAGRPCAPAAWLKTLLVGPDVEELLLTTRVADAREAAPMRGRVAERRPTYADEVNLEEWAKILEQQMREAAAKLDFERAALLRDELLEVKTRLGTTTTATASGCGKPVR